MLGAIQKKAQWTLPVDPLCKVALKRRKKKRRRVPLANATTLVFHISVSARDKTRERVGALGQEHARLSILFLCVAIVDSFFLFVYRWSRVSPTDAAHARQEALQLEQRAEAVDHALIGDADLLRGRVRRASPTTAKAESRR